MDLTAEQHKGISTFIQDWSRDSKLEVETSFGLNGVVDSNTFLQIAQRLRTKGFEVLPQEDYLNIITPKHIRLSLQGLGVLQTYCKDDTLQHKSFTAMIKDRAVPDSNIDLREYDIRFKIRREEEISSDDPRIKEMMNTWNTQKKAFRLIRRWSFKGKGIRVDMSIVRQTPNVPGSGEYQWSTTFLQRNVLQELSRYEVEVELLHGTEYTDTPEKALKALISGVGEVQRAIQKNSLLIRNSVAQAVRTEYLQVTGSDRFRGVGPVTMQVQNMTKDIVDGIPNIRSGYNVTDKADGLRAMGFVDHTGELYLIDQSLNVYRTGLKNPKCTQSIVDGEWVTVTKDGKPIHHYLIFDIYHYNNEQISKAPFVAFNEGLLDTGAASRYNKMKEWFDRWQDGVEVIAKGVTDASRLMIALKRFSFASANNDSIFKRGCASILDSSRIYHTDGLILTSNSEPIPDKAGVRFNQQFKWKPAKDNTVDFLIEYEHNPVSPKIDKVTSTIHPSNGTSVNYKTMRLYVGGEKGAEFDNPRNAILSQLPIINDKNGDVKQYRPILFNPLDFPDTMANICHVVVEMDTETMEEFVMTEDTKEPISNRSIVEMRYEPSREPGWRWVPSRIRHDKTERLLRATAQAKAKGGKIKYSGMMNDEAVANSVWNSIHDPVTESMIRNGTEMPTEEEMKDILKIRESEVGKKYYERKAPKENIALVKGLLDFHNKYIKNDILIKRALQGGNKKLLDLACGKGGDLYKWYFGRAEYVMGVDIAGENITNPTDGAYRRYVDAIREFSQGRVPKIAFAIGNSSKALVSGEAAPNPEERDIMRSVFGKDQPEGPIPKYIQNVMAGTFRGGADVAACMFAIHYFFESEETLNGLLRNLSDTVKVGGTFIGCCFDGDKIFQMLRTVPKGQSKTGQDGDVPIWTITKDYDHAELIPDESAIGLGIDVNFISIGSTHKEYLVPFELLTAKLATIGFRLLNTNELAELSLTSSTNTFDVSHTMAEKGNAKKKYNMSDSVKQFSFLNRWFIFKRHGLIAEKEVVIAKNGIVKDVADDDGKEDADGIVIPESAMGVPATAAPTAAATATATAATAALPPPTHKFAPNDIFRFGADVPISDSLKIGDTAAGRWISPTAPFPIPDPNDENVKYPTIEHYMAAMKIQLATDKPEMAKTLMSDKGKIHQDFATKRRIQSPAKESAADFNLLAEEATEVRKKSAKAFLTQSGVKITKEQDWISNKDTILRTALQYRWDNDKRFHDIIEACRNQLKYLLYSTSVSNTASDLGGTRDIKTLTIKGENKMGKIIMEIAGFKW